MASARSPSSCSIPTIQGNASHAVPRSRRRDWLPHNGRQSQRLLQPRRIICCVVWGVMLNTGGEKELKLTVSVGYVCKLFPIVIPPAKNNKKVIKMSALSCHVRPSVSGIFWISFELNQFHTNKQHHKTQNLSVECVIIR